MKQSEWSPTSGSIDPSEEPSVLHVLLVEDSKHDARTIIRALDRSEPPCEVTHCIRAEDAVEILDAPESVFDVVVSDLLLPGMQGLEFCTNLAREKPDQAIVVLTGHGSESMAVQALKAGVDDYVIKDPDGRYFQMLPIVISQAARQSRERIARKRAEEALQESEEKNRLLVENAPYCIYQMDRQGQLIPMNPAGLAMLDVSEEHDIIGRAYLDLVSERAHLENTSRFACKDTGFWMRDSGFWILDAESIVILSHPASRILHRVSRIAYLASDIHSRLRCVTGVIKPLTLEMLQEILEEYFADRS